MPTPAEHGFFLATGAVPGVEAPTFEDRLAYVRANLKDVAFKKRAWPHFACFVDASNVARWDPPPVHKVNEPKAKLWRLERCEAALRKLGYVPIMVSDGNLGKLMDEPFRYDDLYTKPPHSVAKGYQADRIVLRALRELPEAACVTRDRYDKPEDREHFAAVLEDRSKFFMFRFDADGAIHFFRGETPMPSAARRLAARWGAPPPAAP